MNLVWHIVRKDLRRHWPAYLIWIGLLLAKVAICASVFSPASADAEWFERMQVVYGTATVIAGVTGFLLAASFALDDELVGSNMFWATRPISGLRLLAAKVAGALLLFMIVPVVVWLPWWLWCGSGVRELWVNGVFVLFAQGIVTGLAVLIAALTGRSSRFLLLLLSALLGCLLIGLIGGGRRYLIPPAPEAVLLMRNIIGASLWAVTLVAVLGHQYRTRRTLVSCLLAVGGVGLGIGAFQAWPWALTNSWKGEISSDVGTEAVQVEFASAFIPTTAARVAVLPGYERLSVTFRVRQVPAELRLLGGRTQLTLRWPDGERFVGEVRLNSSEPKWIARAALGIKPSPAQSDPETRAYQQQLIDQARARKNELAKADAPPDWFIELKGDLIIPRALAGRFSQEHPECSADVRLSFTRPQVRIEVPLAVGARGAGDGVRVEVVGEQPATPGAPKPDSAQFTVVSFVSRSESVLYASLQRASGAMQVQEGTPDTGRLGAKFSRLDRRQVWLRLPTVRRGEAWAPAPGSDGPLTLAVATYESGRLHAHRQCALPK